MAQEVDERRREWREEIEALADKVAARAQRRERHDALRQQQSLVHNLLNVFFALHVKAPVGHHEVQPGLVRLPFHELEEGAQILSPIEVAVAIVTVVGMEELGQRAVVEEIAGEVVVFPEREANALGARPAAPQHILGEAARPRRNVRKVEQSALVRSAARRRRRRLLLLLLLRERRRLVGEALRNGRRRLRRTGQGEAKVARRVDGRHFQRGARHEKLPTNPVKGIGALPRRLEGARIGFNVVQRRLGSQHPGECRRVDKLLLVADALLARRFQNPLAKRRHVGRPCRARRATAARAAGRARRRLALPPRDVGEPRDIVPEPEGADVVLRLHRLRKALPVLA